GAVGVLRPQRALRLREALRRATSHEDLTRIGVFTGMYLQRSRNELYAADRATADALAELLASGEPKAASRQPRRAARRGSRRGARDSARRARRSRAPRCRTPRPGAGRRRATRSRSASRRRASGSAPVARARAR